jgi:diacylglycerol kinase (ATP)
LGERGTVADVPTVRSRSILWSFDYAIRGIVHTLRTQRNMRFHLIAAALVFIAALVYRVSGLELIALIFAVGLVFVCELMNTAVETVVDLATQNYDPLAAIAKDVSAGAVLISAVIAVSVGYVVFFSRVTLLAQSMLSGVKSSPAAVTVLALALTSLAVLGIKAATLQKGESYLSGGWPSGHTALAFAVASAIAYITMSAKVAVLALFIAALVGQSRVESEAHTIPQTVAGGLLGFLLATAAFQILWR